MSFLSLLAALLLEQFRPLPPRYLVHAPLVRLATFLERRFNAGERRHGIIAWSVGIGGTLLFTGGVTVLLAYLSPFLAWSWNVAVLYLAMGFRQSSHFYTQIRLALRMEDLPRARRILAEWRGYSTVGLTVADVARQAMAQALHDSHRRLFAVFFWFLLLPGPYGAVLYRVAACFASTWGRRADAGHGEFGRFARQTFAIIDWLPVRLTAAGFAIVGDFEDAVYCWRTQADKWSPDELGIVLASASGALDIRLDTPAFASGESVDRTEIGTGDETDVDRMERVVSLVLRALVLWLLLLGLANLVGD